MRVSDKRAGNCSIEELERLIAEKKKEEAKAPAPLDVPNFDRITVEVKEYIASIERGEEPKDIEHWLYESAIEAVFGPKIWNWINSFHR